MRSAWHHDARIRLTDQQTAKLFLERNGCCHACGRKLYPGDKWIVEHRLALENGGDNSWANLTITCEFCKPKKDAKDHAQAGKQRRAASKHLVPESLKQKSRMPGNRNSKWKKKLSGEVVER